MSNDFSIKFTIIIINCSSFLLSSSGNLQWSTITSVSMNTWPMKKNDVYPRTYHGESRMHFIRDPSVSRIVTLVQLFAAAGNPRVVMPLPQKDGGILRKRVLHNGTLFVVRHRDDFNRIRRPRTAPNSLNAPSK